MQRKKILILSSDFDSCFSIFSSDAYENLVLPEENMDEEALKEHEEDVKAAQQRAAIAKQALENFLTNISANHDAVELYVASFRQSMALNKHYMKEQGSDSCCFETYTALCKAKGWTFRKLLLADTQNGCEAGTAMYDENLQATLTHSKLNILIGHIEDAKRNHPDAIIDVCFFDDDTDNKYIPEIQNYFANNPLPKHINNLSLVRYDYFETVNKNMPSLMKKINIAQPRGVKLELNSKTKLSPNIVIKEMQTKPALTKRKLEEEIVQVGNVEQNNTQTFFTKKTKHEHIIKNPEENMNQIIKTGSTYRWM